MQGSSGCSITVSGCTGGIKCTGTDSRQGGSAAAARGRGGPDWRQRHWHACSIRLCGHDPSQLAGHWTARESLIVCSCESNVSALEQQQLPRATLWDSASVVELHGVTRRSGVHPCWPTQVATKRHTAGDCNRWRHERCAGQKASGGHVPCSLCQSVHGRVTLLQTSEVVL